MSTSKADVFRGALRDKSELIALFKALDEHTQEKYRNLPYFDLKSPLYGAKTRYKGYRPTVYGTYNVLSKKFGVSRNKIYDRMQTFPNGVDQSSKPSQAGARSVTYEKWELTPTHKLIMESIGADKNSVKAKIRDPTRYKETYKKQGKYDHTCYLAWKAMGAKTDLLEASLEQWLIVWGKNPKAPNQCHVSLKDPQTGLISYSHTSPLRWCMKYSNDPQVKNLIVIGDERFNTKSLKRDAGQHKKSYFTEEQCFLLPQAIDQVDTLVLAYCGMLFGGRFSALSDLTPDRIDYNAHKISFFESKIQKTIEKPIYEPETSFIRQYIIYMQIGLKQPLFKRSIRDYNEELRATVAFFSKTDFPLNWTPTTHTAFKHTCVTQMSLHGVRMDTISDYIGTDPNTLKDYYRGGSEVNVNVEIGGMVMKQQAPTWAQFRIDLTKVFAKRYEELTGRKVVLPSVKGA